MDVLKITVAASALCLCASGASAAILSFETDGKTVNYQVADTFPDDPLSGVAKSGNPQAGSFRATQTSGTLGHDIATIFDAFCLDIAGNLAGGNFVVTDAPFSPTRALSDDQIFNVKDLYNASYNLVDNVSDRDSSAAFQLALWEVAYETYTKADANFDLSNGNFKTSTTGNIRTLADSYLALMTGSDSEYAYKVRFLDADTESAQDLVTATVVPLPAAGLLLFGAIGALGVASRRRNAASGA